MVSIPFVTAVVSLGFMVCVALVMSYFAYLGLIHGESDDESRSGNRSSLAD